MNRPEPDPAITALAREVEHLSRTADTLRTEVDSAQHTAESAHRVLIDLADRVAAVADQNSQRPAPSGAGTPDEPVIVSWLAIEDERAARETLADLVEWMTAVLRYYPDTAEVLTDCWPLHPAVVEELLALRYAWAAAYTGKQASAARAMDWHDRHRPGTTARIANILGGCARTEHQPGRLAGQPVPEVPGTDIADTAATRWANE